MPADLNVRNVLELDGVTVSADGRTTPILDGVSCALKATEILEVVGETGAGKSILDVQSRHFLERVDCESLRL